MVVTMQRHLDTTWYVDVETTLEDLEGTKMPLAQRIVIVAAVICIIGAVVYYLLAMR